MNVVVDGVRYVPYVEPCENPGLLDFVWNFADAGGEMTIREYLAALLKLVWSERESFSGRYPFGNSGWEFDIYEALVAAGAVDGVLDEDKRLLDTKDLDRLTADAIVARLINEMCKVKT